MVERLFLLRQWGTVIVPYSYFKEMDMKVTVIMEKRAMGITHALLRKIYPASGWLDMEIRQNPPKRI